MHTRHNISDNVRTAWKCYCSQSYFEQIPYYAVGGNTVMAKKDKDEVTVTILAEMCMMIS